MKSIITRTFDQTTPCKNYLLWILAPFLFRLRGGMLVLLTLAFTTFLIGCSKSSGRTGGDGSPSTTASDGGAAAFTAAVTNIDTELDECTESAIATCGEDDSCLIDAVNTCLGTAIPDWADAACEDTEYAADYPEVCDEDAEVETCSEEVAKGLEATGDDTDTNMECTVACICQFYVDLDQSDLDSCSNTCEETEPEADDPVEGDDDGDGYNDECVEYFDGLLSDSTIDPATYDYNKELYCRGEEPYTAYYLHLGESIYYKSSLIEDPTWGIFDGNNANDSTGASNSAEVQSWSANNPNTVITGFILNAYWQETGWYPTENVNVECIWFAYVDLKEFALTGEWAPKEAQESGYSGDGVPIEGCDGSYETKVDLREEPGMVFTGVQFDGEDCGVEAGVYRRQLLEEYDDTEESYLADVVDSYYMAVEESSGEKSNRVSESYHAKTGLPPAKYTGDSTGDSLSSWCSSDNSYNGCNGFQNDNPDNSPTKYIDDDIAIVGIGIKGTTGLFGDGGEACGINLFVEYQELSAIESAWNDYPYPPKDAAKEK